MLSKYPLAYEVLLVISLGLQKTTIMVAVSSQTKQIVKADKSEIRRKLRESRNYNPLVHLKKDAQRSRGRASLETKEGYKKRVKLYEE